MKITRTNFPGQKLAKFIRAIEDMAELEAASDELDFNAEDYAGGNYDDAYEIGCNDGQIFFARQLLKEFF